jgi:hypothetical protein
MFKGLNKTSETTSLLGDSLLKHSSNFLPIINGIEIREGMSSVADNFPHNIIAAKAVTIGGIKSVLFVDSLGVVIAVIPELKNRVLTLGRRWFGGSEQITLGSGATVAEILEVGNNIYLLSNDESYVVKADGFCYIDDEGASKTMIVDALHATIIDAERDDTQIWRTENFSSFIPMGTPLSYRVRNEFGGRGSMSQMTYVPKDSGYVLAGVKGMRQDVFGVHNSRSLACDIFFLGVPWTYDSSTGDFSLYTIASDNEQTFDSSTQFGYIDNQQWRNITFVDCDNVVSPPNNVGQSLNFVVDSSFMTPTNLWNDNMAFSFYDSVSGDTLYNCTLVFKIGVISSLCRLIGLLNCFCPLSNSNFGFCINNCAFLLLNIAPLVNKGSFGGSLNVTGAFSHFLTISLN